MKIFFALLNLSFGSPAERERRQAEIIDCPGRCWEFDGSRCTPMAGMISLDCSDIGTVSVSADSCLFTPDNALYSQNYTVFFGNLPTCSEPISDENATISFDLTYQEAEACGWAWATSGDYLSFSSFLRASDNVNKVNNLTISVLPDDIDLTCNFENWVRYVQCSNFGQRNINY